MTRGPAGSAWLLAHFLLLATLHPVVVAGVTAGVEVEVWTSAEAITVSILPLNLSHHRILVSVKQENNDTKTMVIDTLPEQVTNTQEVVKPIKHTVGQLQPDTSYELCVALSDDDNSKFDALQRECYKVKTFPKVDNFRGLYAFLAAVGTFLLVCALGWLLYTALCARHFAKTLHVQDSQEEGQPMESRPAVSPAQYGSTTEMESTSSSTTTTT